jgi:hypothetical protein
MTVDYFPKTTVTGLAFCNRVQERKNLSKYIDMGRHVWIQAHRRHGKTSLVEQTIADMKLNSDIAYSRCHLRFASDLESCIRKLVQSIDELIYEILTTQSNQ